MPFISFTTNHKLTLRQENEIAKRTGGADYNLTW